MLVRVHQRSDFFLDPLPLFLKVNPVTDHKQRGHRFEGITLEVSLLCLAKSRILYEVVSGHSMRLTFYAASCRNKTWLGLVFTEFVVF